MPKKGGKETKDMGSRKTVYRDSKDGQFIKKGEAERRPSTTEKERVRTGQPTPKKK